jgi:hypothetical protein
VQDAVGDIVHLGAAGSWARTRGAAARRALEAAISEGVFGHSKKPFRASARNLSDWWLKLVTASHTAAGKLHGPLQALFDLVEHLRLRLRLFVRRHATGVAPVAMQAPWMM